MRLSHYLLSSWANVKLLMNPLGLQLRRSHGYSPFRSTTSSLSSAQSAISTSNLARYE